MLTLAIQPDRQPLTSGRVQSFSQRWTELAEAAGHRVRRVSVYDPEFFSQLDGADGFMWWFAHLPYLRNLGKRIIPAIEHGTRIRTFPGTRTIWHFDDKVAQAYLLEAAGIPSAKTWVLWNASSAWEFLRGASYPVVLKLASGITSDNVTLLRSTGEAEYWIGRLFGNGVLDLGPRRIQYPKALVKHLLNDVRWQFTGKLPVQYYRDEQRGYLLVQEFLPGNEYDTRITVIGNRAFAFRRFNRPGDFRASGSGRIDWNPAGVDPAAVRLAFRAAHSLGTQSLAVDALQRNGEPVLVEISYYYEGWAVHACPGHWELRGSPESGDLAWMEGQVRPEDAIFEDFAASTAGEALTGRLL